MKYIFLWLPLCVFTKGDNCVQLLMKSWHLVIGRVVTVAQFYYPCTEKSNMATFKKIEKCD